MMLMKQMMQIGEYGLYPMKESSIPVGCRAEIRILNPEEILQGKKVCAAEMVIYDQSGNEIDRVPCELRKKA